METWAHACTYVQGGVLTGLVTMLDDGLPPMQRAATGLLATLANLQSGCKALCQVSRSPAKAASCHQLQL